MRIFTLLCFPLLFLALSACKVTKHEAIDHDDVAAAGYPFEYADTAGNTYLRELREEYRLEGVVAGAQSDRERALRVLDWSRKQWNGHGKKLPSKGDALTILEEADRGRKFRCVEYATVTSAALSALGMPSRRVGLKKKSVETAVAGGGHMVAEVWLADEDKWVVIDGEYNLMPVVNGRALNAVEFKRALQNDEAVGYVSAAGPVKPAKQKRYREFIERYLYYFNTRFDERRLAQPYSPITYQGKTQLMLVPKGAAEPTRFQRKRMMDKFIYTRSVADFYEAPRVASR
ncbi:hypothetical protein LEM8419_03287 [Neolewinella maritima]|uniref:Transglutaminase-like domain-containing protein n=1 Tax=Neolewinella maritima TaxID=1383882 RepID=A0ABM9B4V8_9BACT|nr:transglutaminase-like domain-containing protein [Neolewinella maritima]CAH1002388.1 hypothetical protein LEM8419_03287 [Neolewinella maritima]